MVLPHRDKRPQIDPSVFVEDSARVIGDVAIGRRSQKAAVSTAAFFTRVGKSIAGSF